MSRVASPPLAVDRPGGRRAVRIRAGRVWEPAAVAALVLLALVARRPDYMLSQAFWVDEGWVADSVLTRWLKRVAKLDASARMPLDGLALAEFPAGRP
jgi:hypothetical protein